MSHRLFSFPNPVNEVASRVVAAGVVAVGLVAIIGQQPWLSAVLAYGFLARVATGPTLSPLGQIATRLVAPRIAAGPRHVPGPPKRFAQGVGLALTGLATLFFFIWHLDAATYILLGLLVVAASLESALGYCLGCRIFSVLMRAGVVPPEVCLACSNLESRGRTV